MNTLFNTYFANGIIFTSEIEFSGLLKVDCDALYEVRLGEVPNNLGGIIFQNGYLQRSPDQLLLNVKGVAKYLIKSSGVILIDPYQGSMDEEVKLYFLSLVLAVLLYNRGLFLLHACSFVYQDKAILVAGDSGVGKSTLAFSLFKNGFEVLNDDISSIYFDKNHHANVYAGFLHLKLMENSLTELGHRVSDYPKICKDPSKYRFEFERKTENRSFPIDAIFFITTGEKNFIEEEAVFGIKAFQFVQRFAFRSSLVKPLQLSEAHFQLCSQIGNSLPLFHISRPATFDQADFRNYLETRIKERLS